MNHLQKECCIKKTNDEKDLVKCMNYGLEAVNRCSPKSHFRPIIIYNFAWCYQCRWAQTLDLADLNAAIGYFYESLESLPSRSIIHLALANDLSAARRIHYEFTKEFENITRNVGLCLEMLDQYPPSHGHPERVRTLSILASSLRDRFDVTRDKNDITNAIQYARENHRNAVSCNKKSDIVETEIIHQFNKTASSSCHHALFPRRFSSILKLVSPPPCFVSSAS